jgi:hypothetical protein
MDTEADGTEICRLLGRQPRSSFTTEEVSQLVQKAAGALIEEQKDNYDNKPATLFSLSKFRS